MIELSAVSVRGPAERGRARASLANTSLAHGIGTLAIIGAHKDGTSLLFDVIDGTITPKMGRVAVLNASPDESRSRIARVSLEAPLPDALRVAEVCDTAADLRGEPRKSAGTRLGVLGVGALAERRVRSLSLEERRAVALAIALTSSTVQVLLVEEPLVSIDPVAPRLVIEALRARANAGASVVVTTASPRDATRLADRLGLLTSGIYAPLSSDGEQIHVGVPGAAAGGAAEAIAVMRVVITPRHGKHGASKLVSALSNDDAVIRVETTQAARSGSVAVVVTGRDLWLLSKAVTHAIGATRVDVELVEPTVLPLDGIRAALAARAASPPPGSLPPGALVRPQAQAIPGSLPPAPLTLPTPPSSMPPTSSSGSASPSGSVPPSGSSGSGGGTPS